MVNITVPPNNLFHKHFLKQLSAFSQTIWARNVPASLCDGTGTNENPSSI